MAMATQEQRIKRDIKNYIERANGVWFDIKGGTYSKPGSPDIIAFFGKYGVGIEAKTPTGVQSPIQKTCQMFMEDVGCVYILVRSAGELDNELRRRGIIKDGTQSRLEEDPL